MAATAPGFLQNSPSHTISLFPTHPLPHCPPSSWSPPSHSTAFHSLPSSRNSSTHHVTRPHITWRVHTSRDPSTHHVRTTPRFSNSHFSSSDTSDCGFGGFSVRRTFHSYNITIAEVIYVGFSASDVDEYLDRIQAHGRGTSKPVEARQTEKQLHYMLNFVKILHDSLCMTHRVHEKSCTVKYPGTRSHAQWVSWLVSSAWLRAHNLDNVPHLNEHNTISLNRTW